MTTTSTHQGRVFKKICESMYDALVVSDPEGTIQYVNPSFSDLFGFTKQQSVGHNLAIIFPAKKRTEEKEQYKALFSRGIVKNPVSTYVQRKNGDIKYVEMCNAFVYKRRKRVAMISLIRDVTSWVLAERRKDDYANIARHELRAPLTTVAAYFQLIQSYKNLFSSPKISRYLYVIEKELNRMGNLINEYLDFGNTGHTQDYKLQLFVIDDLVSECITEAQVKNIKHKIILEGNAGKRVIADREKISQVCHNLLGNAIKYSPAGKVVVRLDTSDTYVRVSVIDNGIGIAQQHLNKIFDNYFRGKNVPSSVPGHGIGLYIARKIIRDHGGILGVKSELNKGSTFFFDLPSSETIAKYS